MDAEWVILSFSRVMSTLCLSGGVGENRSEGWG